jgi:hypothetical protein
MEHFFLYIDPGSGSFLVQAIIAAILGVLFYFRQIWWKVKSFFSRTSKEKEVPGENKKD